MKEENKQAGRPGPTCSLSERDWILQDVLKTLVSSIRSFLIKSQFGLCSLLIFDQDGRGEKRKKGRDKRKA